MKIKVMLSSTVKDLLAERDAVMASLGKLDFVKLIGAEPFNDAAVPQSSFMATRQMAEECNLYMLILGGRYGWQPPSQQRSATEIEFDSAFRQDPTKVLVFRKKLSDHEVEEKQLNFINRVRDYFYGYWVTDFQYSHELQQKVLDSFYNWLTERAGLNTKMSYMEHFVRLAVQRKPEDAEGFEYHVTPEDVLITCNIFGNKCTIQFARNEILNAFWQCVSELDQTYENWRTRPSIS